MGTVKQSITILSMPEILAVSLFVPNFDACMQKTCHDRKSGSPLQEWYKVGSVGE